MQAGREPHPPGDEHLALIMFCGPDHRLGDPLSGNERRPAPVVGAAAPLEERRVDHAGKDQRYAHAAVAKLIGEALGKAGQARLGRRVDRLVTDPGGAGDR